MASSASLLLLAFAFLLPNLPCIASSVLLPDSCSPSDPPCLALIGYFPPSNYLLSDIASLFDLNWTTLFAANDFDPSTPDLPNAVIPSAKLLSIPKTCGCVNRQRVVTSISYTVVKDDTLSNIASLYYSDLMTYEDIAAANNISNPNLIFVGQELTIPIPCACRNGTNQGRDAQFLTYEVQNGDDLSKIAQEYNTTIPDLEEINGLQNSTLQESSIMFVPLQVCKANFSGGALDGNLAVAEGSSALTANDCVQCSCSNGSLFCAPTPSTVASFCPTMTCASSNLTLGAHDSLPGSGGCTVQSCMYMGYTSAGVQSTLVSEVDPVCPGSPPPPSLYKPPTDIAASPLGSQSGSESGTPAPSGTSGTSPSQAGSSAPAPASSASSVVVGVLLPLLPAVALCLNSFPSIVL